MTISHDVPISNRPQKFVFTPKSESKEIFHSFSKGMCPTCRELVDAARFIVEGRVIMRKFCKVHGRSEALISGDSDWWLRSLVYTKPGSRPHKFSTEVKDGCPTDCGLCPDHEQHSCLPIIEITNHCNLECPICIVQNRYNYNMTVDEFRGIIEGLIEKEGTLDTVNLSGGEPTMHPDFLEMLAIADRPEISRISISTNGLRIASDLEFTRELARRNVYVNLQLDALRNPALQALRGGGNQASARMKALENLETAGAFTTIIATIAKGVNDDEIGDCIRLLYEKDFILSLMFQPAAYTGYGGAHFGPHDPLDIITIPDIVKAAEAQTDGMLLRDDFLPLPCSHPSCFGLTYVLKTEDGYIPFPRFLDMDRYVNAISNRGTIRPDEDFEDSLRAAIDDLWSGADQAPDNEKILRALKRSLRCMYPEDEVLDIEDRLHIGETHVKTIFIHAFMDEHTFEVDRIKKCCTHYALPDGRLIPGCAYNMFFRDKDPRFSGPVGKANILAPT